MADLIVVGDRVLVKPRTGEERTSSGLVVPATVAGQQSLRTGCVVKTGPGYLTANPEYSESESWKQSETPVRYLPLQAEEGDRAFFLDEEAIELRYEGEEYLIVPHQAIVALVRDEEDEDLSEEPSDTTLDDLDDLLDE